MCSDTGLYLNGCYCFHRFLHFTTVKGITSSPII
jgi:hypothetical protein